jgi:H+/gluconate symporter-like permease
MNTKTIKLVLLMMAVVGPGMVVSVFAPPPPPPPPNAGAPIDALVGMLLVISAVVGVKYLLGKGK